MRRKTPISDADKALFRDAVGDVKPVTNDKVSPNKAPPPARTRSLERDNESVMSSLLADFSENDLLETGEHLGYTAPGVQRSILRRLKSGRYSIRAELDLHGLTREEAAIDLSRFLRDCREDGKLCVRIIHGKGRKDSDRRPVLKPLVNAWLQRNKAIVAFCSARDNDGGTGAVYVLLKRPVDTSGS